jgi:hypothetical protein
MCLLQHGTDMLAKCLHEPLLVIGDVELRVKLVSFCGPSGAFRVEDRL